MMKFFKFILPALFIFSCANSNKAELDELYDTLVTGHDEVMPKSMAIPSVLEKMQKAVENASEESKNQALEISTRLQKAEEEMNEWMVEFGEAINSEMDDETRLETYRKLQEDIVRLKEETDASIADAKSLTSEFQ